MTGSPGSGALAREYVEDVVRSGERFVRSAAGLSEAGLRAPSGLATWTRGHVLAHVRHSVDAYLWLLRLATAPPWARMSPCLPCC
ncbi:maleylpyruvate isomerase N-terminal domain-containing protein [Streptomyces sp. NPDC005890]|uniref:maleylpyruvate isomerase N-terminal domain-containing protein n=1 Tax=Streptomyces sp. NPDC005890 TaxID=3154568 RepID=UPI0033D4F253